MRNDHVEVTLKCVFLSIFTFYYFNIYLLN